MEFILANAGDGLGSVAALSKLNGSTVEIAEQYRYSAFGETQILSPNSELRTTSLYGNPIMFTGRRLDTETRTSTFSGLYDYRARIYNPALGRFMQTDPIGYGACPERSRGNSMNLYQYCGNNPVNWIDPWGLFGYPGSVWEDWHGAGGTSNNSTGSTLPNVGFEISGSSVNPFTSRGGGVHGWFNWMNFHNDGNSFYDYNSRRENDHGGGLGLDVGINARGVYAWGSGNKEDWAGKFKSIEVNVGSPIGFSFAYFWDPDGGYRGFAYGIGVGLPGFAYEETTYKSKDS